MICALCVISVELGALRINQNLFGSIKFPMNAISLSSTVWYKDFGFKLLIAKSNKTKNSVDLDKKYTNKIDHLFSATILYKYQINNKFSFVSGVGFTTYKTSWKVDGVDPWWKNDTDDDISYQASIVYEIDKNKSIEFGYTDYYRKNKKGFGKETTNGYSLSFSYKF